MEEYLLNVRLVFNQFHICVDRAPQADWHHYRHAPRNEGDLLWAVRRIATGDCSCDFRTVFRVEWATHSSNVAFLRSRW